MKRIVLVKSTIPKFALKLSQHDHYFEFLFHSKFEKENRSGKDLAAEKKAKAFYIPSIVFQ